MAISSVTSGPAAATLNSTPAESVSRDMRAMPPKSQSVMSVIAIPLRIATTACPSSCRRIEAKKARALTTARTYGSLPFEPGPRMSSKKLDSQMITRKRTRNHE